MSSPRVGHLVRHVVCAACAEAFTQPRTRGRPRVLCGRPDCWAKRHRDRHYAIYHGIPIEKVPELRARRAA